MLKQHFFGFWSPFSTQTNWPLYQLHPLTSTTHSGNYRTNQVHRSWATHWWYTNAHLYLSHVSNMPKEHKCIISRSEAFIPDATSHIDGLTVITSKEWIEGAEFNFWKLSTLLGTLHHKRTSTIRRNSCPSPVSTRSGSTARWWRVRRFAMLCPWRWGITRSFRISTSSISLKVISSLDRSAIELLVNPNGYQATLHSSRLTKIRSRLV